MRRTHTIYADPELAAEYTAGAWAAALQSRRRTGYLAVFVCAVIVPLAAAAYVLGFQQMAAASDQRAAAEAQALQNAVIMDSFHHLEDRVQNVEDGADTTPDTAPPAPAPKPAAPVIVVQGAPAPAPSTTSTTSVPSAPATPPPTTVVARTSAPSTSTTTTTLRACVLTLCVQAG